MKKSFTLLLTAALGLMVDPVSAFEGRINATLTQSGQTQTFFYTAGTNYLRLERGETNWPHARNILNLQTGDLTLLFPHNRSFVRLKASRPNAAPQGPGLPLPPGSLPPGVGLQAQVATPPNIPALPMMPMPGMDKLELKATGDKTNLLGYACLRYEIRQRGEVMAIWATDKLLPYQPWQQNQPPRFGPRMIEEQWSELVKNRKLFPLLVTLRLDAGPERFRFEVKAVKAERIADPDGKLFQPPSDYHEIEPLPF